MKISKVFCYSKEVASQHGNKLLPIILAIIISFILYIIGFIFIFEFFHAYGYLVLLLTLVFIFLITYCSIALGLKLQAKLMGWVITEDNRLFHVKILNYGAGLYFGGLSAGHIIDNITNNDNNTGQTLGGLFGSAAEVYAINKATKYAENPNIIAKIVKDYPNVKGAEVIEILKVHSLTEERKKIKIVCDFKYLNYNKIKFNKKIILEKSFNQLDDLVAAFKTHIID